MHGSHFALSDRAYESTVRLPRLTSNGTQDERVVAEECPVALVYDGTTVAVLMATPSDLTDLALGFSLTEGIIEDVGEIEELSVVPGQDGIEVRAWLRPGAGRLLKERRRRLVGPTGCGLCGGVERLEAPVVCGDLRGRARAGDRGPSPRAKARSVNSPGNALI